MKTNKLAINEKTGNGHSMVTHSRKSSKQKKMKIQMKRRKKLIGEITKH